MNTHNLISVEANYEHTENRWRELEDLARQFIQEDPSMEEIHDFDLSIRLAVGKEAEQIISASIEEMRAEYGFSAKPDEFADDWFVEIDDEKRQVVIVYVNSNILSDSNYSLHDQALLLWSGLLKEVNPEGARSTPLLHPTHLRIVFQFPDQPCSIPSFERPNDSHLCKHHTSSRHEPDG